MLDSSASRSSSVFSLDTSTSSCTSYPTSPVLQSDCEKTWAEPVLERMILQWKPLFFSTAFTYNKATPLVFTAFPPQDLSKPLFEQLSNDAAQALLSEHMGPSTLSIFAQSTSNIDQVTALPFPSALPQELLDCLQNQDWYHFSVNSTTICLRLGKLSAAFDHHVALRPIKDGVERYIFGPAGLCIHSTCRLRDSGARVEEKTPRETLYLWEETEVLCHKMLSRWTKSTIARHIAASHEQFRLEWDASVRGEWSLMKMRQPVDLLA